MGSRRPKSAILAVFGGLEIGLRCAGYAGWVCIRCIYDLRRPPGYSLSPQKSVKRLFRGQGLAESGFRVRHDAGVFRPNRRHQRNANGEKTLKPRSFGVWGGRTEKVEAKKPNRKSAKCAIVAKAGSIACQEAAEARPRELERSRMGFRSGHCDQAEEKRHLGGGNYDRNIKKSHEVYLLQQYGPAFK